MTARDLALVTGAARGIGLATADALAARGLDVALIGRDLDRLERAASTIASAHAVRADAICCDVGDEAQVDAMAARIVSGLGVPRVVVNNAGIVHRSPIEETSAADWDSLIATNLRGPFLLCRALLPVMKRVGSGRFIQVGSISGTLGTPRLAAYCASKWGLVGLTKSLAEELHATGLQAMIVMPGAVDTEMLVGSGFAPRMSAADVAGTIVYCALDAPDAMNGAAVEVFGD